MNILSIGNSFSQDAQAYLHQLANAAGVELEAVNLYIGGCSLERHAANLEQDKADYELDINGSQTGDLLSISGALAMREWDIVTFQQASHYSGMAETYEPYLSKLVEAVRKRLPAAKLYFHETWAYEIDSDHEGFGAYGNSQTEMYNRLAKAAREAAARHGLELIPVGNLVQTLREDPAFDYADNGRSLCRDGFHLDLLYGRYLAAATWLRKFTGETITGNSYIPKVEGTVTDLERIQLIQKTIDSAPLT